MSLRESATLFCCAHPIEAQALPAGVHALVTGVGKVVSAVRLFEYLSQAGSQIQRVVIVGVAGVYPTADGSFVGRPTVGELVWVQRDALIDEGVAVKDGFLDLASLSLLGEAPQSYQASASWMRELSVRGPWPVVEGATVSSCSGSDVLALRRVERTQAQVESMEGAALAHVCRRVGLPWVQLRSISNRCGRREDARWDLPRAIDALRGGMNALLQREQDA